MLLIIIIIFIILFVFILVLYTNQERFFLFPLKTNKSFDNEIVINSRISCKLIKNNSDTIILFSHGSTGNITNIDFNLDCCDVLMWDYSDFGNSKRDKNELTFMQDISYKKDIILVYDFIEQKLNYKNIIPYGHSFGTGFTAYLASKRKPPLIILEAPYYDLDSLAYEKVWLLSLFLRWDVSTYLYLNDYSGKIIKFHGAQDKIIDISHSKQLKGHLIEINANHWNLRTTDEWKTHMKKIVSFFDK